MMSCTQVESMMANANISHPETRSATGEGNTTAMTVDVCPDEFIYKDLEGGQPFYEKGEGQLRLLPACTNQRIRRNLACVDDISEWLLLFIIFVEVFIQNYNWYSV